MTDHNHNPKDQKDEQKHDEHKGGMGVLGVAVAMAIGATLGVMFAPKKGEETQKDIADRAQNIAKKFKKTRAEVQKTVEEVFGETSEDLEKAYIQIRADILAGIDDVKDKAKFTQDSYNKMVEDTVKGFSKGKKWTEKAVKNLTKNLEDQWDELTK